MKDLKAPKVPLADVTSSLHLWVCVCFKKGEKNCRVGSMLGMSKGEDVLVINLHFSYLRSSTHFGEPLVQVIRICLHQTVSEASLSSLPPNKFRKVSL